MHSSFLIQRGSITLVAEAEDQDGVIDYVQFMVDNRTTDINGSAVYIVERAPYILNWRPDRVGEFAIRAIAVDNGGVSSISKPVNIKVIEPIGLKPSGTWEFPYEMKSRDPYASFYSYWYGSSFGGDSYVDEDFEVGSSVPLSVRASDDDGQIVDVEFFVDSESIGKVYQRYNGVYSTVWTPSIIGQSIVYAEVTDNDGNIVRALMSEILISERTWEKYLQLSWHLPEKHPVLNMMFDYRLQIF